MDTVKVACDYFKSRQNILLIPNREFGNRKYLHVGEQKPNVNAVKQEEEVQIREVRKRSDPSKRISSTLNRWLSTHKDRTMPGTKSLNKQWLHSPETLLHGQVVYNVKFLGEVEVSEAKGTAIVKEAVRKMRFSYQIKKSEGEKLAKVDIVISVDNVRIQESKSKATIHQYPLHRISYCADEKADSRVFTFIAKNADSNKHFCYGFDSDKCSQDITLTVGQAFDLAYRRYLDTSGKEIDLKKQILLLHKQVNTLQTENNTLKTRICDLQQLKNSGDINLYKQQHNIIDLTSASDVTMKKSDNTTVNALNNEISSTRSVVGRKLEHLVLEGEPVYSTPKISTHQREINNLPTTPALSPPPTNPRSHHHTQPPQTTTTTNGIYTIPVSQSLQTNGNPFASPTRSVDAFGMEAFTPGTHMDPEYNEMQVGFSQGLSFGTDDFSLADLDPLNSS